MVFLTIAVPLGLGLLAVEDEAADSLWRNGAIYTIDGRFSRAGALAVRGGRIVAVGSREEIEKLRGPATRVHDLEGRCVTPGLIDCHAHMSGLGSLDLGRIDLHDARSFAEVIRMVHDAAAKARPGEWILGGRWDQSLWEEKEFPAHDPLSEAAPENPVWLDRVDGHMGLANRKAMAAAGIDRSTADPPGGEILRDARGEPTGLLVDNAMTLVDRRVPGGRSSAVELILAAQERCLRAGLTGIHDAGIGPEEIEAYERLAADGRLKLRVYAMARGSLGPDWFRSHRPRTGDRFSLRAVKLMADGAMGSRGAWLLEPYADRPRDAEGKPYAGLPVQEPSFIRNVVRASLEGGWQVCTHAIGDRAIREALDAYEEVLRAAPGADHRFRIEHAQNPHPADIPRFARLGVIASMQPAHATSDMRWAEARVGPERVKTAYAWRQFLRAGARVAFGSDFPVEDENPLLGIYAAVTRQDAGGNPEGGWLPEEKLTREEAFRLFTIDAARAAFEEKEKGSLEPGKLADFVVWSHDVVEGDARDLLRARPRAVVIGGEVVREAPGPKKIDLVCVDPEATGYGTFQSHNQKVVGNARGLFMTHIRTRNEPFTAQTWRLSWSRDGGATWSTLFEATHATNPPVLETDADANLYVIRPDFLDGDAYLYRFRAGEDYTRPGVSRIPRGAAGKYSMFLDAARKRIHYFAHNNTFHEIDLDGVVRSSVDLLAGGKSAVLQYPLLSLAADGVLHAAWTTQAHGRYLYWDIHHLQSPDGGNSWQTMGGAAVTPPVPADEGGPSDRITLDDEFEAHTWLSSFLVKDDKAHFLYLAQTQPPRQHYVRYDLKTRKRDRDVAPEFKGETISLRGLDGFFATRAAEAGSPLYCVSRDAAASRIACLISLDNGETWHDHAASDPITNPYAIGGAREVTGDGSVIGSFTDQVAPTTDPGGGSKVYFFRIPGSARRG